MSITQLDESTMINPTLEMNIEQFEAQKLANLKVSLNC